MDLTIFQMSNLTTLIGKKKPKYLLNKLLSITFRLKNPSQGVYLLTVSLTNPGPLLTCPKHEHTQTRSQALSQRREMQKQPKPVWIECQPVD